jgi:hypothetical protein
MSSVVKHLVVCGICANFAEEFAVYISKVVRGVDQPHLSKAVVKERVELYLWAFMA